MPNEEKIFYTLHQVDPKDKIERQVGLFSVPDVETAKKRGKSDADAFGNHTTFKVWKAVEVK